MKYRQLLDARECSIVLLWKSRGEVVGIYRCVGRKGTVWIEKECSRGTLETEKGSRRFDNIVLTSYTSPEPCGRFYQVYWYSGNNGSFSTFPF